MTRPAPINSIWLVGCGNMGGAIARSVLNTGLTKSLHITSPAPIDAYLENHDAVRYGASASDAPLDADICILAVKPQIADDVCAELKNYVSADTVFISVAAGKDIAGFEAVFGANQPIIRAMPNTPALSGAGASVLCANAAVTDTQIQKAQQLFEACGHAYWAEDETLMNAVTATSGSGPAYFFYMVEALEKAAIQAGLPTDLAKNLARQTFIGAAALAAEQKDVSPQDLRENVTSPGGTTEAALKILMDGTFENILARAVQNAKQRGEDLSQ